MTESGDHTLGQTATPGDSQAAQGTIVLYLLFECKRLSVGPMRISLSELSDSGSGELRIGRGSDREFHSSSITRLTIPDRWLSSQHAQLQYSFGRWILSDLDSKNGTSVNGETIKRRELVNGDILELGHTFFLYRESSSQNIPDIVDFGTLPASALPLTLHADLAYEIEKVEKLAATDISILILGESGSGKEVLAKHLHKASRRPGSFVPVNCGALPAGLIESELFGHKKGSFSGAAQDHIGLVRSANHGTLFLDELADLPPNSQAALLRVLQEKEVRPVGATKSEQVELRILSATHLSLEELVEAGSFRRDLYARVSGYQITLLPLAARPEDVALLSRVFVCKSKPPTDCQTAITVEAARKLLFYPWPLNVRELQACLTTALILADGNAIDTEHLPEPLRRYSPNSKNTAQGQDEALKAAVLEHLAVHRGNISAVARTMKKDRKQIQRWIKRFEIDIERFRTE